MPRGGAALCGREEADPASTALARAAALVVGAVLMRPEVSAGGVEMAVAIDDVALALAIDERAAVSSLDDRMTSHAVRSNPVVTAIAPPTMTRCRRE